MYRFNIFTGTFDEVLNLDNPMQFKGSISVAADFPTAAEVENGWFYRVLADVTDNDVSKTNTGQSFLNGEEIAWNGADWTLVGRNLSQYFNVPDQTVQVKTGVDEVAGKVYNTIASALAYIATQTPATGNRWGIKLGSGIYSENFIVPEWVAILGEGVSTVLSGTVKSASSYITSPTFAVSIFDCSLTNITVDAGTIIYTHRCFTSGCTINGDGILVAYFGEITGGNYTGLLQLYSYFGTISGGTFSSSLMTYTANCTLIPSNGDISLGGRVDISNSIIWYTHPLGYSTTFTNEVAVANLTNSNYYINAALSVGSPTFNTADRTYNLVNVDLGDAPVFTAGTFNNSNAVINGKNYSKEWVGFNSLSCKNIVSVSADIEEVVGHNYKTIADALAYVATQTPAIDNRWGIKVSGENSENFTIPSYVAILGEPNVTILKGTISAITPSAIDEVAICDCNIEDLNFISGTGGLVQRCWVSGGTFDAGSVIYATHSTFVGCSITDINLASAFINCFMGGPGNLPPNAATYNSVVFNLGGGTTMTAGIFFTTEFDCNAFDTAQTLTGNLAWKNCSVFNTGLVINVPTGITFDVVGCDIPEVTINVEAGGTLNTYNSTITLGTIAGTWNNEGATYDNTTSGLTATEVQGAIDEIDGMVGAIPTNVIQFMQTATLNDFSKWTLTDVTLNGSNQIILAGV